MKISPKNSLCKVKRVSNLLYLVAPPIFSIFTSLNLINDFAGRIIQ